MDSITEIAARTPVQPRREREAAQVEGWRYRQLRRAGYGAAAARLLAGRGEVDLHQAVELPRRGCPIETALRILL